MQYRKHDNTYRMGIDIGSTTVKVVLADEKNEIAFARYRRHFSEIKKTVKDILKEAKEEIGQAAAMVCRQNGMTMEQLKPYYDAEFEAALVRSVLTGKAMALVRECAEITEK